MTALATMPCYLFGVVATDGLGTAPLTDPPDTSAAITDLRLVHLGTIAAVVGSLPADRPLGRAADLRAHDQVLAGLVAAGTPVLPFRFGSVLADEQAVVAELLQPHLAEFTAALERVRGRVQYTVTARYEEDAAVREVLARDPQVAALRRPGGDASIAEQMRLGELVVAALARMRPADAERLLAEITPATDELRTREPAAADEVMRAAVLVPTGSSARFEALVEDCGRRHAGRLRLRLVGPVAPYDFVPDA